MWTTCFFLICHLVFRSSTADSLIRWHPASPGKLHDPSHHAPLLRESWSRLFFSRCHCKLCLASSSHSCILHLPFLRKSWPLFLGRYTLWASPLSTLTPAFCKFQLQLPNDSIHLPFFVIIYSYSPSSCMFVMCQTAPLAIVCSASWPVILNNNKPCVLCHHVPSCVVGVKMWL